MKLQFRTKIEDSTGRDDSDVIYLETNSGHYFTVSLFPLYRWMKIRYTLSSLYELGRVLNFFFIRVQTDFELKQKDIINVNK